MQKAYEADTAIIPICQIRKLTHIVGNGMMFSSGTKIRVLNHHNVLPVHHDTDTCVHGVMTICIVLGMEATWGGNESLPCETQVSKQLWD